MDAAAPPLPAEGGRLPLGLGLQGLRPRAERVHARRLI